METNAVAKAAKRPENIALLYEITKALNEHLDLKRSLYKVLDILSSSMNMVRGTITLLDPLRNEIRIEVAHGITRSAMERVALQARRGGHRPGHRDRQGRGDPAHQRGAAVPGPHRQPQAQRDREISFICVPIKKGSQVIGALERGQALRRRLLAGRRPAPAVGHRHHDGQPRHQARDHPARARAPARRKPAPAGRSSKASTASATSSATATGCGKSTR